MQLSCELRSTEPHLKPGEIDDVNARFAPLGTLAEFQIAAVTVQHPTPSDPAFAPIIVSLDGRRVDL